MNPIAVGRNYFCESIAKNRGAWQAAIGNFDKDIESIKSSALEKSPAQAKAAGCRLIEQMVVSVMHGEEQIKINAVAAFLKGKWGSPDESFSSKRLTTFFNKVQDPEKTVKTNV